MKKTLLSLLGLSLISLAGNAQCPTGTGADGPYTATGNVTLASGTYNFTSFTIDPGAIVTVTGSQPLIIRCTGAATINGMLNASGHNGTDGVTYSTHGLGGLGVAGGGNGGDGSYSNSSGPLPGLTGTGAGSTGTPGGGWSGGGGAGYATSGASSGNAAGGFGGPAYGTIQISGTDAGSGGGGGSGGYSCGSGGGGGGGGYVAIHALSINIGTNGTIAANGGNGGSDGTGNCGGGGAGSGGSIWIDAPSVTHNGALSAIGGVGGASNVPGNPYYGTGGNGANGRIRIDYDGMVTGTGSASPASGYSQVSSILTATASATDVTCGGGSDGSVSVSVTGGNAPYAYAWTPGNYTTQTVVGLPADCYTVVVTDANGCTVTATACITEPPVLTGLIAVMNVTCYGACDGGASISVTGGTPPYTYLWTPGNTTSSISNQCAGCFTVTVTDAMGCTLAQNLCITEPAAPTPNVLGNDTIICMNETFTLCAPGGFTSYAWSTGSTSQCILVDTTECYMVMMVDMNGCVNMDTLCVIEDPCLGIPGLSTTGMNAYPNPASNSIRIAHGMATQQLMQIVDMRGSIVLTEMVSDNEEIDISRLAEGVYTIRVNGAQQRLVITR